VLVAPWVAAQMTDLLQSAVLTGTGRAAQIGRPVAGKTGTTSSNKDGWFIGFSSGLTAGVWMGRDDAKPIAGLQGGTAPARAFAQYMKVAVAKRPVEQFQTKVTLPEFQLEPDNEAYFGNQYDGQFVDENGMPADPPAAAAEAPAPYEPEDEDRGAPPPQRMDRREEQPDRIGDLVESITGRRPEPEPRERRRQRPPPDDYYEPRPNQ
jgi:penicillin-binding protein 1A